MVRLYAVFKESHEGFNYDSMNRPQCLFRLTVQALDNRLFDYPVELNGTKYILYLSPCLKCLMAYLRNVNAVMQHLCICRAVGQLNLKV